MFIDQLSEVPWVSLMQVLEPFSNSPTEVEFMVGASVRYEDDWETESQTIKTLCGQYLDCVKVTVGGEP